MEALQSVVNWQFHTNFPFLELTIFTSILGRD